MATRIARSVIMLIAAVLVGTCFACASGPPPVPDRKPHAPAQVRAASERLMGLSVAILNKEPSIPDVLEGTPPNGAICTGTWVGPDEILTAFHCVVGATSADEDRQTRNVLAYLGVLDLRGEAVRFALASDVDDAEEDLMSVTTSHLAVIDRVSPDDDIAIIKTVDLFNRDWARIVDRPLEMGERIQGVVMSGGFPFSWAEGYVTRPRRTIIINYVTGEKTLSFQAATDMWRGSSGACTFDDELRCMGVFVATAHGDNSMGFVIHHERVRALLARPSKSLPLMKAVVPTL